MFNDMMKGLLRRKKDKQRPPQNERLRMLRDLDVEAFDAMNIKLHGETLPTREMSLAAMHKARYKLAVMGHFPKRIMMDSRRWLIMRGYKLPEA